MKNEKNVDFPLNNMGNLQKDEEMARAWGGGQTNKQIDKRTNKSPPVFYRTLSPLGPLPKNLI